MLKYTHLVTVRSRMCGHLTLNVLSQRNHNNKCPFTVQKNIHKNKFNLFPCIQGKITRRETVIISHAGIALKLDKRQQQLPPQKSILTLVSFTVKSTILETGAHGTPPAPSIWKRMTNVVMFEILRTFYK